MKTIKFGLPFLLMVFQSNAQWFQNGKVSKQTEYQKQSGKFAAMLLVTDKPDELFKTWNKNTVGVNISAIDSARKGEIICAIIMFSGCSSDQTGNCNSTVSFQLLKPNGDKYGELPDGELWINKLTQNGKSLELSVANLMISFDPPDPIGTYTIIAAIDDHISNKKMILKRVFKLK